MRNYAPSLDLTQLMEHARQAKGGRDIPTFLKQYPEETGTSQLPLNNKTRKVGADYHSSPLFLRKSVFCLAWICIVLFLPHPALPAEPVKIAVIPSVLNLFIQQSILLGVLEEDPSLFDRTISLVNTSIEAQPGFALSSKQFGIDDEAATQLMLSTPYPNRRENLDADILVFIGNADNGRKAVEVFIVASQTGRGVSSFIDFQEITNATLPSFLNERILRGLTYAPHLLAIGADKIIDPQRSVVQYQLLSLSGKDVFVNVDYDDTHERIEHTLVFIKEEKEGELYTVELPSKEGPVIKMTYLLLNGVLQEVEMDTDFRPPDSNTGGPSTLTTVSAAGHEITFNFYWNADGKADVVVIPTMNPYLPHLLENF